MRRRLTSDEKVRVMRVDAVPNPPLMSVQRFQQRKVFHTPNIHSMIGRRRCQCSIESKVCLLICLLSEKIINNHLPTIRTYGSFKNICSMSLQFAKWFECNRSSSSIRRTSICRQLNRQHQHHPQSLYSLKEKITLTRQINTEPALLAATTRVASRATANERIAHCPAGTLQRINKNHKRIDFFYRTVLDYRHLL